MPLPTFEEIDEPEAEKSEVGKPYRMFGIIVSKINGKLGICFKKSEENCLECLRECPYNHERERSQGY